MLAYNVGQPVARTPEFDRILALPRRPVIAPKSHESELLVRLMTLRLRREREPREGECTCPRDGRGRKTCILELLPVQAWALYELSKAHGLLAPIGVGHGKTGLDILAPLVMPNCQLTVLLLKSDLRNAFKRAYDMWAQHWHVPNLTGHNLYHDGRPALHLVSYAELSRAGATDLLERRKPDFVIADEAQKLANRNTSTTKRVERYINMNPTTRFAGWSGTITSKSLKDFAHLSAWALRSGSPVPRSQSVVEQWANAVDASVTWRSPPGVLEKFCNAPDEPVRMAVQRRMRETYGVVSTDESALGTSLVINTRDPGPLPPDLLEGIQNIRKGWVRPDGEELYEVLQVTRCVRELASGLYLRWRWPKDTPREAVEKWLHHRKEWNKELRSELKKGKVHLDSPLLLHKAAKRFYTPSTRIFDPSTEPLWAAEAYCDWERMHALLHTPDTEPVWVSDFLAQDVCKWIQESDAKREPGIVWYEHTAFGERVAALSGAPLYGAGDDAELADGKRTIVCSIKSQGTGKNLQKFARNLVANLPSDGAAWEQMLGRTHRQGQLADEVEITVYQHLPELIDTFNKAKERAQYIQEMTGSPQKLLLATYV